MKGFSLFLISTIAVVPANAFALQFAIDVNSTNGLGGGPTQTAPGFTELLSPQTGGDGTSILVNGSAFEIFSSDGSRNRGASVDVLTRDFIFDDDPGAAVGLRIDTLPSGTYMAEVWAFDSVGTGDQIVGFTNFVGTTSIDGTSISSGETTFTTNFPGSETEPFVFFFNTNQVAPNFGIFTRENNNFDRSRFNALRLTLVPEPQTYALFGLGLVGLIAWRVRRRRKLAAG